MDSGRWRQIEQVFHTAAGKDAGTRAVYLEHACNGDRELRAEVESLLARDADCADFMEAPAVEEFRHHMETLFRPLAAADMVGPYEILGPLGEGGMGEVYRARDSRLNRDVAIKKLPAALAYDSVYLARFEREAQLLASLNHPNIASVYGIEQGAIVMELVEGADIRGPLPPGEVIAIARQIALALEAAHEKGIVHRDLKPANIRITSAGAVKLLDFGLAKAGDDPASGSHSPRPLPAVVTGEGMILGTAAYMSPEQARGKALDKRTDIWAFGVVVYELLTGKMLFGGETAGDSTAAVIASEPDWQSLPKGTPPHVVHLLERCLRKDPRLRLRDIGEARILLDEPEKAAGNEAPTSTHSLPLRVVAGISFLLALAMAGLLWRATRPLERPLLRFRADIGPDAVAGNRITAAISPDGASLVYSVRRGDTELLAIQRMDQSKPTVLGGTENGADPFFSPDGQWIGFAAGGYLKKVSIHGGAPVSLSKVEVARGGWWGDDGSIVFASAVNGLAEVSADGGASRVLTKPSDRGESTHRYPQVLPGGDAILFTGLSSSGQFDDANLEVLFRRTGETRVVQRGGYFGRFLPGGHLVFIHQGSLFAVPFDLSNYRTRGVPVPVLDDVAANPNAAGGQLDFSRTGTLVYLNGKPSAGPGALFWLDAAGKTQRLVAAPNSASPRLSPDGKRLAFSSGAITVYDLARGVSIHLAGDKNGNNQFPVWTPDGSHIVYSSTDGLWWTRADGSGEPQLLFRPGVGNAIPWSFSPDGRNLMFDQPGDAGHDLWTLSLDVTNPEHPTAGAPRLFPAGGGDHLEPAFSPDGRWLAYSSTDSGVSHIFVRPFPEGAQGGGQEQVSTGPGRFPVWSRAAREIFYVDGANRIMVAPYKISGHSFRAAKARSWNGSSLANTGYASPYDLTPDGKRFVTTPAADGVPGAEKGDLHLTFLLNFFEELNRRFTGQEK